MDWQDSIQLSESLTSKFSKVELESILDFYALHRFLKASLPTREAAFESKFEDAIAISAYGQDAISELALGHSSKRDLALAALILFFHRDLVVDIHRSNFEAARKMLEDEFKKGLLRLPGRFGRELYDRFGIITTNLRIEHLTADQTDKLLQDTEQGIYQIGKCSIGPLGIVHVDEIRYLPPTRAVPLWHCSDPGCEQLHAVELLQHPTSAHQLADEIRRLLKSRQGPASEWVAPISKLGLLFSVEENKSFYDALILIAECLSPAEFDAYMESALQGATGHELREKISALNGARKITGSAPEIVRSLGRGDKLQLCMTLTDRELAALLDEGVRSRRLKVPPTEIRRTKTHAPKLFKYSPASSLSNLGVRSDREHPVTFLASAIWNEYQKRGLLSDLAWRAQKSNITATIGIPFDYVRLHGAREAIRNLILPSESITHSMAENLNLALASGETRDELIERFLWKFGFNLARHEKKYERFKMQLDQFRSELVRSPAKLTDDRRDVIRSKGVNVFVSLENFLEELIAYNVWILASDHFGVTKFSYRFETATARVATILGPSKEIAGRRFFWRPEGGNALGTLLVYARLAADWMLELPNADKRGLIRRIEDYPHFAEDPDRRFPFKHCALWADAQPSELRNFSEQFNEVVGKIERSRLAEVRNGLDHYREPDKFPSIELMLACHNWLSAVFEKSDEDRLMPKPYWLSRRATDKYGILKDIVEDYAGRKIEIDGPSPLSGLRRPDFLRPALVPHGNLLGDALLVFYLTERSEYSNMWENYPRRSPVSASNDTQSVTPHSHSIVPGGLDVTS